MKKSTKKCGEEGYDEIKKRTRIRIRSKKTKTRKWNSKKTLKIQKKEAKEQYEIYEDLLKENKSVYYKQKYEIIDFFKKALNIYF